MADAVQAPKYRAYAFVVGTGPMKYIGKGETLEDMEKVLITHFQANPTQQPVTIYQAAEEITTQVHPFIRKPVR